jgi:hypothetical protein
MKGPIRALALIPLFILKGQTPNSPPVPPRAPAAPVISEAPLSLTAVKRIYVDRLGGGEAAERMRDLLINSLQATGRFILTENDQRADAFLRGSAEDNVFSEVHDTSERVDARAAASANPFGNQSTSTSRRNYASVGVGLAENQRTTERKHEALAAVRLVDRNGDVIWTCTKESLGAKFQGSSVHVADQIVKQLLLDLVRK